jgi:hypothetical protein
LTYVKAKDRDERNSSGWENDGGRAREAGAAVEREAQRTAGSFGALIAQLSFWALGIVHWVVHEQDRREKF